MLLEINGLVQFRQPKAASNTRKHVYNATVLAVFYLLLSSWTQFKYTVGPYLS